MEFSKLVGLKKQAQREGWAKYIRYEVDERALLAGYYFCQDSYDHFRYFTDLIYLLKSSRPGKFEILDFQDIIFGSLFGWMRPNGTRRFRRGYIERAKKNSKTTDAAIIGLYMFMGDGEPGAEVYNMANDSEQASILWGMAAKIVRDSPHLNKNIRVIDSTKRLLPVGRNDCLFAAWSSEGTTKDGPNIHCGIVDELHEWKLQRARDFWGKIRYGGIARSQPLCPLVITTAGNDKFSLCFEQHTYAKKVIAGYIDDFAYFASIDQVDPIKMAEDPDYWKTEEAWKEANPGYGQILNKEDFEEDIKVCENDPNEKARFLRYRLSHWIGSDNPWLASHVWNANAGEPFKDTDLKGLPCFAGLDMSSVEDFTALSYVFPYFVTLETGEKIRKFKLFCRVFCPEDTFSDRIQKLGESIIVWKEQGWLTLTPGNAIDHEFILDQIKRDSELFNILELGYDRNSAAWIIQQMQKQLSHIELFPVNQSMVGLNNATKSLTIALKQYRVEHGGNPLLGWMASNAVPHFDAHGNMMLHKGKSTDKIDGIIASILAFGQAELGELKRITGYSVYSADDFEERIKKLEGVTIKNEKSIS